MAGQKLALRVQLTSFSTVVSRMPVGSFSSMPMRLSPSPARRGATRRRTRRTRCTMNRTISTKPKMPERVEGHRPRVQEDDLDVEDDEEHRGQVELDREPAAADRLRGGLDAALVGVELGPVVPARPDERARRRPRRARTPRPGRRARGSVRTAQSDMSLLRPSDPRSRSADLSYRSHYSVAVRAPSPGVPRGVRRPGQPWSSR